MVYFRDRLDAGERLGAALAKRRPPLTAPLVLALPRGGVPVGDAVARALRAPLEVFVVRKIGAPMQPEYAIGAIAEGGVWRLDEDAAEGVGASAATVERIVAKETLELERRVSLYRSSRELPPLQDRTVVVVDDGLATGLTAEVACTALRSAGARRVLLAVPVGSPSTVARLEAAEVADEVVCLSQPESFRAVGQFYADFSQTSDDEVLYTLAQHHHAGQTSAAGQTPARPTWWQRVTGAAPAGSGGASRGSGGAPAAAAGETAAAASAEAPPAAAAGESEVITGDAKASSGGGAPPREPGAFAPAGADEGTPVVAPASAAAQGAAAPTTAQAAAPAAPAVAGALRMGGGDDGAGVEAIRGSTGLSSLTGGSTGLSGDLTERMMVPEPGPDPDWGSTAAGLLGATEAPAAAVPSSVAPPALPASSAAPAAADVPPPAASSAAPAAAAAAAGAGAAPRVEEVTIRVPASATAQGGSPEGVLLPGTLTVPPGACGIVLFAHGSGSGRLSPRNRFVADVLNQAGIATLLFDLLTESEAADRRNVFDIPLLASRLTGAAAWLEREGRAVPAGLPLGFFGASTGAGAALWAAADLGPRVAAVVSRGGRPDLARPRLPGVAAPTLLLVGGRDEEVLGLNAAASRAMTGSSEVFMAVIDGATHLFPEPGALETVAASAANWFLRYFEPAADPTGGWVVRQGGAVGGVQ